MLIAGILSEGWLGILWMELYGQEDGTDKLYLIYHNLLQSTCSLRHNLHVPFTITSSYFFHHHLSSCSFHQHLLHVPFTSIFYMFLSPASSRCSLHHKLLKVPCIISCFKFLMLQSSTCSIQHHLECDILNPDLLINLEIKFMRTTSNI